MLPLSGLYPPTEGIEVREIQQALNVKVKDDVSKPKHYKFFDTEAKYMIYKELGYKGYQEWCKGSAMKYRLRAGKKTYSGMTRDESILMDIKKAEEFADMAYDARMGG